MKKSNIIISLLAIIFLTGWLYRSSFDAYFFQDDWFSLRISQAKTLGDFFSFFIPRTDVIYYRPLGMQIPFFFIRSFFGINPQPFHYMTLFTHFMNIFLVFFLIRALFKKLHIALLTAFLYATSAVHFIPMYWLSTYPFVLGPSAFFLSFFFFISAQSHKESEIAYISSIIIFGLGILVNEMVVTLPAVLFLYLLLFPPRKSFKILIPYFFIAIIILLYRFVFFSVPTKDSYQMSLGFHIISNLKTYLFWSFNWSEIITEQMVRIFIFNNLVMKDFANYAYFSIFTLVILFLIISLGLFLVVKSKKDKTNWKFIFLGIGWFVIGLSPVIFFSGHKFAYYLPISLVGLLLVFNVLFEPVYLGVRRYSKILGHCAQILILLLWALTSIITIDLGIKQHWAPRRAQLSKLLIEKAKQYYYPSGQDLDIYVYPTSENKLSLNDQDAFKIIFANEKVVTQYTTEAETKEVL